MKTTKWLAAALLLATALPAMAEEKLESRTLLDGKITMLVPAGFAPLSDEYRRAKYPSGNGPAFVLTDESTEVNIAMDHKQNAIAPEQLKLLESPMREQFSSAKINAAGVRAINGREFLVFDLDVELPDGPNHNLLAITSLEGRMLIVSYNCMPARHANCADLGNRLIGSIQVKGK